MQYNLGKVKGRDGNNCYIRYSAYEDGRGMEENWRNGLNWLGIAIDSSQNAPNNPKDYKWSQFVADNVVLNTHISQNIGNGENVVMSQNAICNNFVTKTQIKQDIGNSVNDLISQKGITDALEMKLNKADVCNGTGTSSNFPISQRAATNELNKKVPYWNLIYAGVNYDISELDNGIYFITKLSGGSNIRIGNNHNSVWLVSINNDAIWANAFDGSSYYFFQTSVFASITEGSLNIFKIQ